MAKTVLSMWITDYNAKYYPNCSAPFDQWISLGISAVQHERGPRKPKLHSALLASSSHQSHLQLQGLVSSAYTPSSMSAAHSSGFHPVIPHIHHPQPLPFAPILHPAHHPHPQTHHGHHLLPVPSSNDFYKNFHPVSRFIVFNRFYSIIINIITFDINIILAFINDNKLCFAQEVSAFLKDSLYLVDLWKNLLFRHIKMYFLPSYFYFPPKTWNKVKCDCTKCIITSNAILAAAKTNFDINAPKHSFHDFASFALLAEK